MEVGVTLSDGSLTCNNSKIIKGSFIYLFFVVNPSINSSLNLSITRSRNSAHVLLCCKAKTNRSVYQRLKKPGIGNMFFPLLLPLFAFLASVSGHGGVLWPPTWQAGVATPIEEIKDSLVFSTPTRGTGSRRPAPGCPTSPTLGATGTSSGGAVSKPSRIFKVPA